MSGRCFPTSMRRVILLNAKSAHLYTQQMLELPHKMPAEEQRQFTEKGFFIIRLLERFWNCLFSDQTIEQFGRSPLATYQEVCETYKSYILSRYNSGVTVVFNGHAGHVSTKSAEQNAEKEMHFRRYHHGTTKFANNDISD